MDLPFESDVQIEFGDCDPAGIVFYPRYLAWFDATFHRFLRSRGTDQRTLRARFGTLGTGLTEVSARFRAPARPGDLMTVSLERIDWEDRTFALAYTGRIMSTTVVEGREVRGLFEEGDGGRLRLRPLDGLRGAIDDV